MKRLHALGTELYGRAAWDAKRAEIVHAATKHRSDSASDLTHAEASRIIAGLVAKQAEMKQPDAAQKAAAA